MPGASTRNGHPAPFPLELATRLVKMFSFVGDTVVDPFCGSGTTMVAALNTGRNSIGVETEVFYCEQIMRRMANEHTLFQDVNIRYNDLTGECDNFIKE